MKRVFLLCRPTFCIRVFIALKPYIMAGLLLAWANGFKLSRPLSNVEADFANGYLFAELLALHNQQDNFRHAGVFGDSGRLDEAVKNFSAILPTLTRLGVKCTPHLVQEIVQQKPGAACHLLYDLHCRLQRLDKVHVGRGSDEVPKPLLQAKVRDLSFFA